ncbi:MULE transposase domain-containing protein [Pochonia chlamydosporia 170]|uniref:MULE transposase domain-containing protein n=1 Tax=Pochonia chlamydosporia 170 TaxID=1380566 RepID=A0A219AN29_METCM|nr:MULE transposase domain-containing protein [Pochonia chlamydosporia 170]OWT42250.1 MULE transposase domain-containing protein [Pochonia chlamydosporia 170]
MDICRLLNALSPSPGRTTTATAAADANDPTDDDYTGATIPQLPPSPLFDSESLQLLKADHRGLSSSQATSSLSATAAHDGCHKARDSGSRHHRSLIVPSNHGQGHQIVYQEVDERELANENGIRAREMVSIVRKADSPGYHYFRTRDIYNDRQAIKRERLNGLTATQAFVKELESGGIRVRTLRDEDDRVCAVFWTYDWCRTMWKKFPVEVISPDKEQALRTALMSTFPGAQQQLCVYHILANVRAKINARWKGTEGDDDDDISVKSDNNLQPELDLDVTARGSVQDEAEEGLANPSDDYSREGMFKAFRAVVYAVDHDSSLVSLNWRRRFAIYKCIALAMLWYMF